MNQHCSRSENEIPLYLLPHAVALKVQEWGDAVYRISVKRMHWHHYNVTVRTKRVPRELATRIAAVSSGTVAESAVKRQTAARNHRCSA